MIKHLYIKNFVLIDELNLDFESGFSAFTGETGAGKSILIDALSLLSSERASASFVMKGKDKAVIEGTFDLSGNPHAAKVLQEAGLDLNEETTFTREISASGKSVIRIDRRIATLSLMKDCLRYEIDIHGQRDNQYLLSTANHIRLLDEYISAGELTNKMHEAFRRYDSLRKEKEKALTETYNENDLEYFRYQVSEIEEADLKEGEDEELAEKEKNFKAMQNSFSKVSQFFALYDESVSDGLYQMNRIVSTLPENDQITQVQTAVNDAYYAVADAAERLHQIYDDVEMSEEEINRMEERLFTIQKLKRKYGRTIPEIMERRDELLNRIEAIENRQSYIDRISRKVNQAFQEFTDAAVEVSKIRHDQSAELDDKVRQSLLDLKLEHARFHTSVTEGEPSVNGIDKVEFMISMNPGEELKPLSKTASGGELSRLMLGLKEIFSRLQGIQTVIFDEIDTGVSGPVASAIGRKMKQLSASCQVFSVTHLAQVASFADQNYLVSKSVQDDVTRTEVHQMNRDEIITQLALIASGVLTESSLQAAKELYGEESRLMAHVYFHIDLNAFFANAEVLRDPSLKGKPLVVSGQTRRSVVSTASYEARKFGIHSAMPIAEAEKLCRDLEIISGHFELYRSLSSQFMSIVRSYTPLVEQASIDECYADMTDVIGRYKYPLDLAWELQKRVLQETGLPCSIGVAPNLFLAKMASEMKKPMGITVLRIRDIQQKMWPLPISEMRGIGRKTVPYMKEIGIHTIGDLARWKNISELTPILGKNTEDMIKRANGLDYRELITDYDPKSIGVSETLLEDVTDYDEIRGLLRTLSRRLSERMKKEMKAAYRVSVRICYYDFRNTDRSVRLDYPVFRSEDIFLQAISLFDQFYDEGDSVRLLGISADDFAGSAAVSQMNLFDEAEDDITDVIEDLNRQMGIRSFVKASSLVKSDKYES